MLCALANSLRNSEENNSPNIAQDFGPYSVLQQRVHIEIRALCCKAEYGPKDKQDWGIIFFRVPNKPLGKKYTNVRNHSILTTHSNIQTKSHI